MSYLSIEAFLINFLNSRLEVTVSGDIPTPRPPRFVTLEQTGSRHKNYINSATIAIQSWAETRADALELNQQVVDAMDEALGEIMISDCQLQSYYNFPDLSTKKPRYQAVYEVVHFF